MNIYQIQNEYQLLINQIIEADGESILGCELVTNQNIQIK